VVHLTLLALCVLVAGGCGGSDPDASPDDARSVLENLESLGKGEIVIQASSSRTFGPFTFQPGGYVFRFERTGRGRLTVTLELGPRQGQAVEVIDTTAESGRRSVTASGKLRVRVTSTARSYELRFTPRQ
jgi:hypothetical protein